MTQRINDIVMELTSDFALSLAFMNPAKRHGLELKFDNLHERAVACISEHVLMLVDGNEARAEELLRTVEILALVTVIAENFVSHLVTREMGCKSLWVEESKVA